MVAAVKAAIGQALKDGTIKEWRRSSARSKVEGTQYCGDD